MRTHAIESFVAEIKEITCFRNYELSQPSHFSARKEQLIDAMDDLLSSGCNHRDLVERLKSEAEVLKNNELLWETWLVYMAIAKIAFDESKDDLSIFLESNQCAVTVFSSYLKRLQEQILDLVGTDAKNDISNDQPIGALKEKLYVFYELCQELVLGSNCDDEFGEDVFNDFGQAYVRLIFGMGESISLNNLKLMLEKFFDLAKLLLSQTKSILPSTRYFDIELDEFFTRVRNQAQTSLSENNLFQNVKLKVADYLKIYSELVKLKVEQLGFREEFNFADFEFRVETCSYVYYPKVLVSKVELVEEFVKKYIDSNTKQRQLNEDKNSVKSLTTEQTKRLIAAVKADQINSQVARVKQKLSQRKSKLIRDAKGIDELIIKWNESCRFDFEMIFPILKQSDHKIIQSHQLTEHEGNNVVACLERSSTERATRYKKLVEKSQRIYDEIDSLNKVLSCSSNQDIISPIELQPVDDYFVAADNNSGKLPSLAASSSSEFTDDDDAYVHQRVYHQPSVTPQEQSILNSDDDNDAYQLSSSSIGVCGHLSANSQPASVRADDNSPGDDFRKPVIEPMSSHEPFEFSLEKKSKGSQNTFILFQAQNTVGGQYDSRGAKKEEDAYDFLCCCLPCCAMQ